MTENEIGAIIDELLDEATLKAWGPEAGFLLALELGMIDGDVVDVDDAGRRVVSTPAGEIARRVEAARAARASGLSMAEHFG
jgi:hypothetical protein